MHSHTPLRGSRPERGAISSSTDAKGGVCLDRHGSLKKHTRYFRACQWSLILDLLLALLGAWRTNANIEMAERSSLGWKRIPKYCKLYATSYSTQQHQKHEVKTVTCCCKVTFIITKEKVKTYQDETLLVFKQVVSR
ncbi:hypothetical protein OPV22_001375 [Ensete ventricosum]|uniref:Uncharacterized protein n=1 Tax=Ensete ventricosum TaxID=4639 RepID=A0AAV8RS64_ENSVE|nr:hypothetical protein OPV22_001375 [Ensete ventricosum]